MEITDLIKKKFGSNVKDVKTVNERRIYIEIPPAYIREASEFLFNDMKFRFSIASGIDEADCMEILYHFSFDKEGTFVTLKVKLEKKNPEIDTISDIITGAKWIEREMHELLGIGFRGNRDLRNLLLSPDYKGKKYPLRKDV